MVKEFERIILPIDGSENAKKAAKKAFTIAINRKIDIYAIYVIPQTYYYVNPELLKDIEKIMLDNANFYLDEIEKLGIEINFNINKKILFGIPYEEIIKFSKINDLIVIGNKGKTGLKKILIGSVAEKVIRHAPCDILIVKSE